MHETERAARAASIRRNERNTTADGSNGPRTATIAAGLAMATGLLLAGYPAGDGIDAALSGIGAITAVLTFWLWLTTTEYTNTMRWPKPTANKDNINATTSLYHDDR